MIDRDQLEEEKIQRRGSLQSMNYGFCCFENKYGQVYGDMHEDIVLILLKDTSCRSYIEIIRRLLEGLDKNTVSD